MIFARYRQYTLLSLLLLITGAAMVFGFVLFKHREAEMQRAVNRAAFYARIVTEQEGVTGPPMIRVVAADTGEPVARVVIGMTLIGPDGGDGGFQCFLTKENGIARMHHPLRSGRYQHHLVPDPKSRYAPTEWRRGEPYIVVASDGTIRGPDLKLKVAKND